MWWTAWFTLLGFFHLFTQLCKDRFEYVSISSLHNDAIDNVRDVIFQCSLWENQIYNLWTTLYI